MRSIEMVPNLVTIILASVLWTKISCQYTDKVLHFPGFSTSTYVSIAPDFSRVQKEISVCSWVKRFRVNSGSAHWFSYATSTTAYEFTIADYLNREVQLLGNSYSAPNSGVGDSVKEWQHCCVTWSYAKNLLKLYVNGNLETSVTPSTQRYIATGGWIVFGQEQDSVLDGFDLGESFSGEIYQLNVFDRPLTAQEIGTMFRKGLCSYLDPSRRDDIVLSWQDILTRGSRYGSVSARSIRVSECTAHWNTLEDFQGRVVTANLIAHFKKTRPTADKEAPGDKVLRFSDKFSLQNYVLLRPDFSDLQDTFSVCSWVKKTKDNTANSTWFSYATSSGNEILLYDYLNPSLMFSENRAESGIDGKLNEWQHCCVTMSSTNVRVYVNGTLEDSVTTNTSGKRISSSGTLVLGQKQEEEGGGFNINNTFAGDLHQLSVFKRPLTDVEVWYMFQSGRCSDIDLSLLPDLVLGWGDVVIDAELHGAVSAVPSGSCSQWDKMYDFRGWEITEELIDHLKQDHLQYYF